MGKFSKVMACKIASSSRIPGSLGNLLWTQNRGTSHQIVLKHPPDVFLRLKGAVNPWDHSKPHWESTKKIRGEELHLGSLHLSTVRPGSSSCSCPAALLFLDDTFRSKEDKFGGLFWLGRSISQKAHYPLHYSIGTASKVTTWHIFIAVHMLHNTWNPKVWCTEHIFIVNF